MFGVSMIIKLGSAIAGGLGIGSIATHFGERRTLKKSCDEIREIGKAQDIATSAAIESMQRKMEEIRQNDAEIVEQQRKIIEELKSEIDRLKATAEIPEIDMKNIAESLEIDAI